MCQPDKRFVGVVSALSVEEAEGGDLTKALLPDATPVSANLGMRELVRRVASMRCPVPVVDDAGCFCGTVSQSTMLNRLQ